MAAASEVNYFYKDENGKILRVLNKQELKQETQSTSLTVFDTNSSSMGAYNQMTSSNQTHYERVPTYTQHVQPVEDATYTVISSNDYGNNSNSMTMYDDGSDDDDNEDIYNPSTSKRPVKKMVAAIPSSKLNPATMRTNASIQKKRKPDKAGKGLRYFAGIVRDKLQEKRITTYNEVADEIVEEEMQNDGTNCDEKNIRRRIYDALNVLMAIEVISKDKKELRWIGPPSNMNDRIATVEKQNAEQRSRIVQKSQQVRELLEHLIGFKSLVTRNKEAERQGNIPAPNSSIQLPFIIINTHKSTKVNCSVTNDKSEYTFKFDDKFEMHDDAEVLKRMGFLAALNNGHISEKDLERVKKMVPPNFEKHIEAYAKEIKTEESQVDEKFVSE